MLKILRLILTPFLIAFVYLFGIVSVIVGVSFMFLFWAVGVPIDIKQGGITTKYRWFMKIK